MESSSLWFYSLVPVMFPSLIITDLINNEKLLDKILNVLYKPFKFIFNIYSPKSVYLILITILCGAPTNARAIKLAIDNNEISKKEAHLILEIFSTLSLAYTIYILRSNNISILAYYLSYIIISAILMHMLNKPDNIDIFSYNKVYKKRLDVFFSSIKSSTIILFSTLGIIIFFNILISTLFNKDFFLYPYLEIMGGLDYINKKGLGTLSTVSSLTFLSLSIHFQILSNDINFSYFKFLIIKIICSLFITFIFFLFC
jgi:hypothetical protein